MPTHAPIQRILVHEHLSAGGTLPGLTPAEHDELRLQGRAMHDAMLQDLAALPGLQLRSTALDAGPSSPAAALLADAARRGWHVWAVAPESDGLLAELAHAVPASHWLGCTPDAIALTSSKSATRRHLASHGLPVPAEHGATAWVVKPDDGAGGTDTRRHTRLAAAEADARSRPGPSALEPWTDGEPLSLSLVCGSGTAELLAINRQHIHVDETGQVHFQGVSPAVIPLDSAIGHALAPLAAALAAAVPGLRGYVGVDLVWTPAGQPVVIEVNPRLTSAYVGLSARLGFNVAARVLAAR